MKPMSSCELSKQLEQTFKLAADFKKRIVVENVVTLYFLETIVNVQDIQKFIIEPLHQQIFTNTKSIINAEKIMNKISSLKCQVVSDVQEIEEGLINGFTFLSFYDSFSGLLIATQDWKERSVEEVVSERAILGPTNGFNENLQINLNMIRNHLRSPKLAIETKAYGEIAKTQISILYLNDTVDQDALKIVKERVESISTNYILESRLVEDAIEGKPKTVFNLVSFTDRVDRATSALLEGKVAVIVDRIPHVIIAPTLFVSFFQAAEDYHAKNGRLTIRMIRFINYVVALTLPGIYVALSRFHLNQFSKKTQEILFNKGELLPTFLEVLLLIYLLKLLFELGTTVPKSFIILLTLVSTISIGQSSVDANLIHPVGLIITSLSSFLSYSVTQRGQTAAGTVIRYLYLIVGFLTGFTGMLIITVLLIIYISRLKSVGVPYLTPIIPFRPKEFQDVFFRGKLNKLNNKNHSFPNADSNEN